MIVYIGVVGAILTTASFIPQALHTIKTKNTRDISLAFSLSFTGGVFLWLVYGILIKDIPLILANSITFLLSATILGCKVRYK